MGGRLKVFIEWNVDQTSFALLRSTKDEDTPLVGWLTLMQSVLIYNQRIHAGTLTALQKEARQTQRRWAERVFYFCNNSTTRAEQHQLTADDGLESLQT